jgi:pimeloyl-ACP methyl ester carboxylesterase
MSASPEIKRPETKRLVLQFDVTEAAGFGEQMQIAAELVLPEGKAPEMLFVCIPGGGMNRRYFDLPTPEGEEEVSFARYMTAKGYAVALIDPIGVGDSTVPSDPYELHPDRAAAANAEAVRRIIDGLRAGTLTGMCPPAPNMNAIAAAHSYGALLIVLQQARTPIYDAVCLMGFHTCGLPAQINDYDRSLDPVEARANLVKLARKRFPMSTITMTPQPSKRPVSAVSATDVIYLTSSYMMMLPDLATPDAAAIKCPVMLVLGDGDLHANTHIMPSAYSGSPDVTLIVLAETRHNHFVYPSRTHLFGRVARWAASL